MQNADSPLGADEDRATPRPIGGLLMIGLLTVPLLFGWLLARRGYSNNTRAIVAIYALVAPTIAFLSTLG